MFLDHFALGILFFVLIVMFYGIIAIHDIPYEISKRRDHPHQDAIHVAGWVSIFTLHVILPFLWIWATLYREDRGWGFAEGKAGAAGNSQLEEKVAQLTKRLEALEGEGAIVSSVKTRPNTVSVSPAKPKSPADFSPKKNQPKAEEGIGEGIEGIVPGSLRTRPNTEKLSSTRPMKPEDFLPKEDDKKEKGDK